ncbi:hypothetical protein BKA63DRAFT_80045 [Paraphoma chrysanthemicola]|nr:hypothetical protein BKA63DRAFT_80045 [Paraphoma chrysanthemicola]
MWKHGIHSFLELLRHRLPDSIDYMLPFIYLAYYMIALLYETVPASKDTWNECLGDSRLRCRLSDSIDYMLAFIYLAYQMMALLYETVPASKNTGIECLGDFGFHKNSSSFL